MFLLLNKLVFKVNQQSIDYFVDKLKVYDNLIEEKENKIKELNELLDNKNNELNKKDEVKAVSNKEKETVNNESQMFLIDNMKNVTYKALASSITFTSATNSAGNSDNYSCVPTQIIGVTLST